MMWQQGSCLVFPNDIITGQIWDDVDNGGLISFLLFFFFKQCKEACILLNLNVGSALTSQRRPTVSFRATSCHSGTKRSWDL